MEILANVVYLVSAVLGYFVPLSGVIGKDKVAGTIVIVHGWLGQNPLHYFMKKYLESKNFRVYMTNFGLQLGDINEYSQKLEDFIEERKLSNVILIGTSQGAVISLLYLQNFNGWKYVDRFIGVCGPFKGAPVAHLAAWSKAGRQMLPNGEIVTKFANQKINRINRIMTISAKIDEFVPKWSSRINGVDNKAVSTLGHAMVQGFSKEVFKLIEEFSNRAL